MDPTTPMPPEFHDPLFVVNPKIPCPTCGGGRKERKNCQFCLGGGFLPVNINGLWWPSAGFLVCGGPSVNKIAFQRLMERGIVSLAVNNVAGHVPVSAWCFSDPQSKFHHGVHLDPKCLTFSPIPKLRKNIVVKLPNGKFKATTIRVMDCPGVFGISRSGTFDAKSFLTTPYAQWGRGGKQPEDNKPFTILETMLIGLRLMHYLGCPRVYMLGVDHNMTTEQPYAFNQAKGGRNGRYVKANAMLKELRPVFESANFKVFNCNQESKCDAFDFVPFDKALEDCRGAVPLEPFDLSGWYDKGDVEKDIEADPRPMTLDQLRSQNVPASQPTDIPKP